MEVDNQKRRNWFEWERTRIHTSNKSKNISERGQKFMDMERR